MMKKVGMVVKWLWWFLICVWSLSIICLFYIMLSQWEYIQMFTNNPEQERQISSTNKCSNQPCGYTSETSKSSDADINSSNVYHFKFPLDTEARFLQLESRPLFLTSNGLNSGRLGNQMFMYASLLGIARILRRVPFISPGCFLDFTFQLNHLAEVPEVGGWLTVTETHYATFDKQLMTTLASSVFLHQNLTISGYLQSWKYFMNIIPEIRTEFTFRNSILEQRDQILKTSCLICQENVLLVGVHVRRSDLHLRQNIEIGYTMPNKSYFFKAFQWMRDKFHEEKIVFLVVSDDFSWCENNLYGDDIILIPTAPQIVHLAVLASCDHVIFSTGTFGWWGAWLAGGIGVYYKNYPEKGTNLSLGFSNEDYIPYNWIGLGD